MLKAVEAETSLKYINIYVDIESPYQEQRNPPDQK
jgi:hypothetical protein